jgi:threonine dehydrogenase-like Zn-dependent dehydrogenase
VVRFRGHELACEAAEVGPDGETPKSGDRIVTAFPVSCGRCFFYGARTIARAITRTRTRG